MENLVKGGASRRKSMPLKVKLNFSSKPRDLNGDGNDSSTTDQQDGNLSDLPEGTIVVRPEPVEKNIRFKGPECRPPSKKGCAAVLENLFCTACGRQVNPWKSGMVKKHKDLRVLICRKCWNFLGSGEIATDDDGLDEQCRWCGEGGRLTLCDNCPRAFCKACIMRNFGRAAHTAITESDNWECFSCNPAPLGDLRKLCRDVFDSIGSIDDKKSLRSFGSSKKSSSHVSAQAYKHLPSSSSHNDIEETPALLLGKVFANLHIDEDNLVDVTKNLFEATSTFRKVLLSIKQGIGIAKDLESQSEEEDNSPLFTLSAETSTAQKMQRCSKVLKRSLITFVSSLAKIVSSSVLLNSNPISAVNNKSNSSNLKCNGNDVAVISDDSSEDIPMSVEQDVCGVSNSFLNSETIFTSKSTNQSQKQQDKKSVEKPKSDLKKKVTSVKNTESSTKISEQSNANTLSPETSVNPVNLDSDNDIAYSDEENEEEASTEKRIKDNNLTVETKRSIKPKTKDMHVRTPTKVQKSKFSIGKSKSTDNEQESVTVGDEKQILAKKQDKEKESTVVDEKFVLAKRQDSENACVVGGEILTSAKKQDGEKESTAVGGEKHISAKKQDNDKESIAFGDDKHISAKKQDNEKEFTAVAEEKLALAVHQDLEKESTAIVDVKSVSSEKSDTIKESAVPVPENNGQQEENLFAKLELIQELAEEFCKGSENASRSTQEGKASSTVGSSYDSDSDYLPEVSFGDVSQTQTSVNAKHKETKSDITVNKTHGTSDDEVITVTLDVESDDQQRSIKKFAEKKENSNKNKADIKHKTGLQKSSPEKNKILKKNGDKKEQIDEDKDLSDIDVDDMEDVSSSDLVLSSDGEEMPKRRRRQRKSKNGLSSRKKQFEAEESNEDEDTDINNKTSKRRVKTTPRKDSQRKRRDENESGDEDVDDSESEKKKHMQKSDTSNQNQKSADASDCELVKSANQKVCNKKSKSDDGNRTTEKKGSKDSAESDSSTDANIREKDGNDENNIDIKPIKKRRGDEIDKRKQQDPKKREKKELDLSEEEDRLEKQIDSLLSGIVCKKKKVKDELGDDDEDEEEEEKDEERTPSRRKGVPKKIEKQREEKTIEDDSLDSSENEKDEEADDDDMEMDDDDDDDDDDENENDKLSSDEIKRRSKDQVQVKESDIENDLAKAAMQDEMDEPEDSSDEKTSDSSSESDVGALRKKKAKTSKEENEKDSKMEDQEDDSDSSDFEPANSHKRLRSKLLDAKLSESDSEESIGKKKNGKKRKRDSDDESFKNEDSQESSEDNDDSVINSEDVSNSDDDFTDGSVSGKKKKGKGKGKEKAKKHKRIKKIKDSSSSSGEAGEGEEGEDKASRKKIRKLMSDKKLTDDTKAAARAEEERRRRVAEKQKKFNGTETKDAGDGTAPITTKLVLEADEKTGDPILQVNSRLICKLKPHQVEAVQFMWDCLFESLERAKKDEGSGCILAHCMGLGKTLSVVTFVHTMLTNAKKTKMKTCLVVCPLNTVLNWQNEWEIWLDDKDKLTVFEMASIKQNWARADALEDWHNNGGIMIIGYEMLRNLSQGSRIRNKKQKAIFAKTLLDPGADIVVCDEGHIMKNAASALSKAMNMIKTRRRIVLTGTPLQNNLLEYHCMVDFVKPSLLGTKKEFANRFVNPIINGQHSDSTQRDVKIMKARAHILHELLAGCVQRRDYSSLTKFLPPKQEYVISVRLTDLQMELYDQYLKRTGQVDGQITTRGAQLFKDYQNLMKIWTHPWVLKLAEIRDESKMKYDDEDSFIDDSDFDEDKSFGESESESEEENMPKLSDGEESVGEGPSGDRRSKRLRKRNSRYDDKDEIVKEWKTRSRGGEEDLDMKVEEDAGPQAVSSEWWAQYLKEEDAHKMEHSGKLVLLFDILRMCEEIGDKVLIFSQSLLSLDIIEDFLERVDSKFQADTCDKPAEELKEEFGKRWTKGEDYFRLDGSTSAQLRSNWAAIFNDPENLRSRLFLISTRAGGLGINLVGANRVIIFDASWNPSHDVQSIFRVYRFGQTKPCYIYRFLAQGTMEEKIYERQVNKLALSQRVVDEHQIERHFTSADLQELYTFRPDRLSKDKERGTLMLPKDVLLAEIMSAQGDWFVNLHEHDSLLENIVEQELTEEEKKAAWEEYENEKKGLRMNVAPMYGSMGIDGFLSQEFLMQTARNLQLQHPDMPKELLQAHLQRIIMMQIRQKQEEQRRLEMMQRQQESQFVQMQQHYAQLQQQYMQQMGRMGMYPPMMPTGPGTRFSPSLYAHMSQPGISALEGAGASAVGRINSEAAPSSAKGLTSASASSQEVIDLDESN